MPAALNLDPNEIITYNHNCPMCLNCNKEIDRGKVRVQKRGTSKKYCSSRCRATFWARQNVTKRQISVIKYDRKPETIEKKRSRSMKSKFKKYGITADDFDNQLLRQNFKCHCCATQITEQTARIDHCHSSGKFRGLLCDHCNWAIGHAKDNIGTLYKMISYLNYDREKYTAYIIGSLRNPKITEVAKAVRDIGINAFDQWISAGPEADDHFQKYHTDKGCTFAEALQGEVAQHIFNFDRSHLEHADAGILVMPAGKSGHLELGYMSGMGKRTYILLDKEPDRYDIMPQFADGIYTDINELLAAVQSNRELDGFA